MAVQTRARRRQQVLLEPLRPHMFLRERAVSAAERAISPSPIVPRGNLITVAGERQEAGVTADWVILCREVREDEERNEISLIGINARSFVVRDLPSIVRFGIAVRLSGLPATGSAIEFVCIGPEDEEAFRRRRALGELQPVPDAENDPPRTGRFTLPMNFSELLSTEGSYRVEVLVDGAFAASEQFRVLRQPW
jgi:hypothetical protein